MSKPVIEVKGLGKSYKIHHQLQRNAHPTIKDDLVRLARKPLALLGAAGGVDKEEFWALDDINFKIEAGEVVGIMGRNGSGKSTLFKILSRITQPTRGEVILRGKTTSLLEVGTGFHPELTGRENVYFNASVLGMKKEEIDAKFDEIVAFSEVEKFLDTPIKFYSSGMKVRLAFSIAAHIDPEILIIDEVLSVGDVRFKQKSLARMKEIAESGKTVLFVSHIVSQVQQLCSKGILLDHGKIVYNGDLDETIDKYMQLNSADQKDIDELNVSTDPNYMLSGNELVVNVNGVKTEKTDAAPNIKLNVTIENHTGKEYKDLWLGFVIVAPMNGNVAMINNIASRQAVDISPNDKETKFEININNVNIAPGSYTITVGLREKDAIDDTPYYRKNAAIEVSIPEYSYGKVAAKLEEKAQIPVILDYSYKKLS